MRIRLVTSSVLVGTTAAYLALFTLIHLSWNVRAHFSLVRKGYVTCRLAEPGTVSELPGNFKGGLDAARLVFSHGTYAGYLDRYANFIPAGSEYDLDRETKIEAALCWLALLAVMVLVCWGAVQVMRVRKMTPTSALARSK